MVREDDRHYRPNYILRPLRHSRHDSASDSEWSRQHTTHRNPQVNTTCERGEVSVEHRSTCRQENSLRSVTEAQSLHLVDSAYSARDGFQPLPELPCNSVRADVGETSTTSRPDHRADDTRRSQSTTRSKTNASFDELNTILTEANRSCNTGLGARSRTNNSSSCWETNASPTVMAGVTALEQVSELPPREETGGSAELEAAPQTPGPIPITYGPDVTTIALQLLEDIARLKGNKPEEDARELGLQRKRNNRTPERYIGEIVHVPARDQIRGSMVSNHFDFATSNAYNHPAVIVNIADDTLTCLKLTTMPVVERWFGQHGPTVGSTFRALLYLPISHQSGVSLEVEAVYGVPVLVQDCNQRYLKVASSINTERMFTIESAHVRTYCTADNRHGSYWRMDKDHSFGFSLSLDSLKALAKYLLETPSLRHFSRQGDGSHKMERVDLKTEGVKWLSQYVQSPDAALVFGKDLWRKWLRNHDIAWSKVVKTGGSSE